MTTKRRLFSTRLLPARSRRVPSFSAGLISSLIAGLVINFAAKSSANAQTIVSQRISAANRLLPLNKITVGPDDQYDATLDPSGHLLVFTHKADLVANLQTMNLKSGDVKDLLPLNADSQEATFGPDGRIAFSFFKFSARGDICYSPFPGTQKTLDEKDIRCLKRSDAASSTQRSNPFWKSANEIGFIERDINTQTSRIIVETLKSDGSSGEQKVLVEGRIWAPSMRPGGRYLAYNELVHEGPIGRADERRANRTGGTSAAETSARGNNARRIVIMDLSNGKTSVLRFALPGISGFPSVSSDEKYLYFSHYLNDTNNDRSIDGEDNAVVFRVSLPQVTSSSEEVLPEQLTSAETSCSFPRPSQDAIHVTCAFEGSLDIYSMPLTGVIPTSWDQSRLTNALQTSRSYQDRILLLNALRLRAEKNQQFVYRSIDDRFMSTHVFSDDTVAAKYYLIRLEASADPKDQLFYSLLRLFLDARELKKAQPSDGVSREFRQQTLAFDQKASKIEGEPRFRSIARGLLRTFIGDLNGAESFLKQARFDVKVRPLERYFYFELANAIYGHDLPRSWPRHLEIYRQMMAAPELTEESQIYYAVSFLDQLNRTVSRREDRLDWLQKADRGLPEPVSTLLKAENVTLRLIMASEDAEKLKIYREMDQLMSKTRDDYFLRKALYVRAIVNFADTAQFKYLNLIATNWLRYTKSDDTEFSYAREVFANSALDQAYDYLGQSKLDFAGNFFYESLSLTDDLESHAGYIKTMVAKNQRPTIDDRYKNLKQRQFVDDNMKFVEALLGLIDNEPKAQKDPSYVGHLNDAIEKLEAMTQDRDSATRHLLLGYSYMEKMMRLASGLDFDADLFQKAHRSLMLAYDIGRDNNRIKAAALVNLGLLHQRAQNFGLSARFFALRKNLGFTSADERTRIAALYARSLSRSNQAERAAIEIASVAEPSLSAPLLERQAFYSMSAGKYSDAAELYAKLGKTGQVSGDENLAKVSLAQGFALFKLKKFDAAKSSLASAIEHLGRLNKIKADKDRITDFEPDRLKMVAYGLLSQMGQEQSQLAALERRMTLLKNSKALVDDWQPKMMLGYTRLAELYSPTDLARAAQMMNEALKFTEDFGDANQYLGHAVFRSTANYLAHGLLYPQAYAGVDAGRIEKVVTKCIEAYEKQKIAQPMLDYQKLKLQMLWAAFSSRILGKPVAAPNDVKSVLGASEGLKEKLPVQWEELQSLGTTLNKL